MQVERRDIYAYCHRKYDHQKKLPRYKPDMIPEDVLEEILKAGTYAATGMGKQSPVILAVTNPEVRQRLSEVNAEIMGVDSDPFMVHR